MQTRTLKEACLIAAAATLGWWGHGSTTVHAASAAPADISYQFDGIAPNSALTLYNAAERNLYVYQNAASGNGRVNCSYRFHIPQPGAPIQRDNCTVGSAY
jgi:hypothetical protein